MKFRNVIFLLVLALGFSGCFVFSFYPLYTEKDLFPNDLLLGEWVASDSAHWHFEHLPVSDKKNKGKVDSTGYLLTIKEKDMPEPFNASFQVKIIQLKGHYFLDFYLDEYKYKDPDIFDLHMLPVHTFAKVVIDDNQVSINWFDQEWLSDLIKDNKIRIHHEDNGEHILLTAKPRELQKFVIKYVNSEDAFKDGVDEILVRR